MKIFIIVISIVAAVFVVYITVLLLCFYEKGMLSKIHTLKKAKKGQLKIACVGDSITYGSYHLTKRHYSAALSKLLGSGYCVNNFGYSGRTAMKDGDFPYTKEKIYRKSLEFNPDKVVIMFGTNDSKPYNWKGTEKYKADLLEIVNSYKALESKPEIYLLAPPPTWGLNGKPVQFDIDAEVIAHEVRMAVKDLCAEYGFNFIDMYSVFEGKSELFQDGVHPNVKGARLFAETVYNYIR